MSFQPQRFFSLSNSTNPSTTTAEAAVSSGQVNNRSKFLDQSSLDLLVRAASEDKSGGGNIKNIRVNGMSWLNNLGANPVNNSAGNNGGAGGAPTSRTTPDRNNPNGNVNNQNQNLQHAFLQTMAQQAGGHNHNQGSAMFGAPSQGGQSHVVSAGGFSLANGGASSDQAQQFGNLFSGMNQGNSSAGGGFHQSSGFGGGGGGLPQSQASSQSQGQWNDQGYGGGGGGGGAPSLAAQAAAQGDMISQLVASLQAQQQAQQQAQVQAALARAFGPGAGGAGGGGTFDLGGIGNGGMNPNANAAASAGGNHQGLGGGMQGLSGLGLGDAGGSMSGMSGQGPSARLQQNAAARDLLSRMQLVQQQQAHQQHDASATSSNATADDLIKLQLEQEHHNRMLQMVQADRQERAMLANQDALMKKARWDIANSGGNSGGISAPDVGGGSTAGNDAVIKNIFNQFPQVAAAAGFPNGVNGSLINGIGQNAAQKFANSKLSSIVGGMNHNGLNAAALQSNLLSAGINSLVGLAGAAGGMAGRGTEPSASGSVGGGVPGAEGQHLHQKLGSARGAAIVPCRARGMPVDHNFKTAYFIIPDGIEHGDELMCSYPACRQAGVKFRYCLQCKVPVAKRNFRNRHRHGVPGGGGEDGESSDVDEESEEETSDDGGGRRGAGGLAEEDDVCRPVSTSGGNNPDDEEDYAGVKKEHILFIPGVDSASAAAFPSSSNTMGKKKRKNVNVRVPCRARGMPMAHNFKTAYFMIPPTIEHGDELLCSFPSCRSAGAKFRYCLHCKVPVAKRNFRNRHKHGNIGGLDKKKGGGDLKSPEGDDKTNLKSEASGSTSAQVDGSEKPPSTNEMEDYAAIMPNGPQPRESDTGSQVTITSTQGATRIQRWVELLENKPDPEDKQAMAVWMLSLMNATEGAVAAAPAPVAVDSRVGASFAVDVFAAAAAADQVNGPMLKSTPYIEGEAEATKSVSPVEEEDDDDDDDDDDDEEEEEAMSCSNIKEEQIEEEEEEDGEPSNKKVKQEFAQV